MTMPTSPMRLVRPSIVVLGLGFALGLPAHGLAQTARAYLSQNGIPLNQQFVLNVEISGTQRLDQDPVLPDLSAFAAFLGSGTSTSMQIVNGRTSMSVTVQHRFQATAVGAFEIGPISVRAGGQNLRTEPLTIRIIDGSAPTTRSGRPGADGTIAPEDLFVTATASNQQVYVNEAVIVEYRIFTRVDAEGVSMTRQPGTTGFWVEELVADPQEPVEQVMRDGLQYTSAVVMRVAVFPTSAGTKTLEPMTLETQVRVQRRSRSLFSDPFGRGLFGSMVPVAIESNPLEIEVLPLPAGQPDAFTGFVGQLEVSASIDRTSSETNAALSYRLEVSGTGNIRTLPEPVLGFPSDVEVYPPEVRERVDHTDGGVRGSKIFEYVIVPRAPGGVTIPAVELAYFDADAGTYAVAASDPITLTVTGDPVTAPGGPVGRRRTGVDLERQDIRFIRIAIPGFRQVGGSLIRSVGFWTIVLVPVMAVAGAVAARRHKDRLTGDVAYARRRSAARLAKQRLARAESMASPDQHREFHAEVGRALQGFLGDKLNVAAAGLIGDEIRARLTARGVPTEVLDSYLGCMEDSDRQRFAPTEPDTAAMQEMLSRAGQAMTDLDQAL